MSILSRSGMCVVSLMVLTLVVGCPDARTSNQGGGSIFTIAAKLMSDISNPPIGDLNADEWQIVVDQAATLIDMLGITLPDGFTMPDVELTDEEAQAIVDFLDMYDVTSVSDLETLIPQIESGEITVPDVLVALGESLFDVDLSGGA